MSFALERGPWEEVTEAEDSCGAETATATLSNVRFSGSDESHPQTAKECATVTDESSSVILRKLLRKGMVLKDEELHN